jgi:uncharacterized protein (TIGR03086 family)
MDGTELYEASLQQATAVVKQILPDHFANLTPDSDQNVRELLEHMLYELSWLPDILAGKTIEQVGTKYDDDLMGGDDIDLSMNWQTAADRAEMAISLCDPDEVAHLSLGDATVDEYLLQAASDQLIHAWDLGKAIGVAVRFDEQQARTVFMHAVGLSASEIQVSQSADMHTRLLALFGRRADWQAA